jgi:hypothetical protein
MRTKITNISGAEQNFGFIPPHGASLANGAHTVLEGDLRTVLASGRGRYTRRRELASLNNCITEGLVAVEASAEPSSSSSYSSA